MIAVNTLGRYFAAKLFAMILVVYGVCIMLVFFIDFVEMMREAAKVDVSAASVLFLTLLRLPAFAELILPRSRFSPTHSRRKGRGETRTKPHHGFARMGPTANPSSMREPAQIAAQRWLD